MDKPPSLVHANWALIEVSRWLLGEIAMSVLYKKVDSVLNGLLIAGIIILMLGLYYWVIKAGIPYQDPTEELRIQYAINLGIGEKLTTTALVILAAGVVGKIVMRVLRKRSS